MHNIEVVRIHAEEQYMNLCCSVELLHNVYNLKVCTRKENHLNPISRIHYKKCAEHFKGQVAWNKGLKFPKKCLLLL